MFFDDAVSAGFKIYKSLGLQRSETPGVLKRARSISSLLGDDERTPCLSHTG